MRLVRTHLLDRGPGREVEGCVGPLAAQPVHPGRADTGADQRVHGVGGGEAESGATRAPVPRGGALAPSVPCPTRNLQAYLQAVQSFPLVTEQEEMELARRYREENDLEAAWRLVTSHLRFVVAIARRYSGYGLPQEDLIQEGNVGLMKAVKRFDPRVGVRLAAFAAHWIRAEIQEFILRNWRIVKVATTKAQRKLFFNLRRAKKRLGWLSREEIEDVAEMLEVRPEDVEQMELRLHSNDAAFEMDPETGDEAALPAPEAWLGDTRYEPAARAEEDEWSSFVDERLGSAIEQLDARSRDIVTRRWLAPRKARLQELADEYGISAERVRQIEARAFAKLRGELEQASLPAPEGAGA